MLRRGTAKRRGGVAIKLAIALPVVAYIGIVSADWARLIHYRVTTQNCARSAALYAADPSRACESSHGDVSAAALSEAGKIAQTPIVDATPIKIAGRPAVRVTVSLPFTPVLSLPGGPADQTVSRSVAIPILANTTN